MKKNIAPLLALLGVVIAFISCNIKKETLPPPQASFIVINASPDAPDMDVSYNKILLEDSLPFGSYTGAYTEVNPGITNIILMSTGTSTELINTNVEMQPGKAYSLFAIDSLNNIRLTAVSDTFMLPPVDSVKLRFLNFSPNSSSVDFSIAQDTILFSNRTFNDQENNSTLNKFISLKSGVYNFEVRNSTDSTILHSMPGISLESGRVYTIYVRGFSGGTGVEAFTTSMIINN